MKRKRTNEIGLEIGLLFGRELLHTDYLHYGYWTEEPDLWKLPEAQKRYEDFVVDHIPREAGSILDVGCGTGLLAARLIDDGHQVDCVSPSPLLTRHARKNLDGRAEVFEARFQHMRAQRQYDLVLFSESFQYIRLARALQKAVEFTRPGGNVLICDFFKIAHEGQSYHRGGHDLQRFYNMLETYPLQIVEDIDITPYTAPTLDLYNHFLVNIGAPVWSLIQNFVDANYPLIAKILRWKFRKKLEKMDRKYFQGNKNGQNFSSCKSYRLIQLKRL